MMNLMSTEDKYDALVEEIWERGVADADYQEFCADHNLDPDVEQNLNAYVDHCWTYRTP